MSEVKWKAPLFKADAGKVYDELVRIGEYRPEDVVNYAKKNKKSELHKCFDWNDSTAAEKWRIHTARIISCNLIVKVRKSEESDPISYRLIQNDKEAKVYRPVQITVRNEDQYSRLVKRALAELAAFKMRYSSIVELEAVIDEIDKLIG